MILIPSGKEPCWGRIPILTPQKNLTKQCIHDKVSIGKKHTPANLTFTLVLEGGVVYMKKELSFLVCLIALAFVFCICESVFAAGGTGNVKQLGKKVYVWSFNEGQGKEAKDSTAGLVGNLVGDIKWGKGVSGKAGDFALQQSDIVVELEFDTWECDGGAALWGEMEIIPTEAKLFQQSRQGTFLGATLGKVGHRMKSDIVIAAVHAVEGV